MIVDSATALFRVDFSGRGELADRQQKLGKMLSCLTKIANEFNIAVFITNQVVSDPGAGAMFVSGILFELSTSCHSKLNLLEFGPQIQKNQLVVTLWLTPRQVPAYFLIILNC